MSKAPNYYIVDAEALPEIFHKVVQARRMLDTGEAETVNQAVQLVGISAALVVPPGFRRTDSHPPEI